MLPVQVKSVTSSRCGLSEASALLQRFLSSDGCADSIAREYVAKVAQALQDSKSGLCGGPEAPGQIAPSPFHSSKLHSHAKDFVTSRRGDEKQSLPSAEGADASLEVESVLPGAEHAFERRTKKRGHFAVENGFEADVPWTTNTEYSALMHHGKKRKKNEEQKTETGSIIKELYGSNDQRHHDRKRKEKQQMDTKIVETDHLALNNQRFDGKQRSKKEKQGKVTEDKETFSVPENMGSPVSLSLAERKRGVPHMDENNVKVSITPMSGSMEGFEVSLRRKRKEGKTFASVTRSVEKEREERDREVSLVEFESLDSVAKEKIKKKKRRKEIGE